jgi:hypothetical protein
VFCDWDTRIKPLVVCILYIWSVVQRAEHWRDTRWKKMIKQTRFKLRNYLQTRLRKRVLWIPINPYKFQINSQTHSHLKSPKEISKEIPTEIPKEIQNKPKEP